MDIDALLRDDIPRGSSFSVAQTPCQAKLDQNESPFEIPGDVKEQLLGELGAAPWHRYPQPADYAETKERFAAALDLDPDRVLLTVGCDQVILLAFWAAGGDGRTARVFEPTYPMFAHYARLTRTALDSVLLGPQFDIAAHGLGGRVDLMALVSPNNPTGGGPDRALIRQALELGGLTFVDEAYADYSGETVLDLLPDNGNLLIGRSLSKAQLAGARLGYGVGHPDLVRTLEGLLFAPYHLSALQLLIARHFALIRPHLADHVEAVVRQRARVAAGIQALGLKPYPSKANFVLFAAPDAAADVAAINTGLLARGVRLRDVSGMPGLAGHLRVTVGTAAENDLFLEALAASV